MEPRQIDIRCSKSRGRYSSETLETSSENPFGLQKSPKNSRNSGMIPSEVLRLNQSELSEFEHTEILEYKSVYFFGKKGICKFNGRFSSKKGIYRGLTGDHLHYRYEILKTIGRGTFGIVFKCWDHKTSNLVAIKIIKCKEKYRKAGELESFILDKIKENSTIESNIFVNKHKAFNFRGHFCIVFELLYCTLYKFLEDFPTGVDSIVVKRMAVQLLQGLKQLHTLRYLHCDLKPDNIMLQYENKSKVKIIDLGSACVTFYKAVPQYIQTRFYRAPEVILGVNYDSSIDYWSLGCVLVELLTGSTLFLANDEEHLIYLIVGLIGDPPIEFLQKGRKTDLFFIGNKLKKPENVVNKKLEDILVGVNQWCLDFIARCLVWDPRDRLNFESGLNHHWVKSRNR